jgi:Ankyrin repeats (3 copies)/Ankyrin repeat
MAALRLLLAADRGDVPALSAALRSFQEGENFTEGKGQAGEHSDSEASEWLRSTAVGVPETHTGFAAQHLNGGATALMLASKSGHAGAVRWLLEAGEYAKNANDAGEEEAAAAVVGRSGGSAHVDAAVDVEDWTALYYAVSGGSESCCRLLLERGANPSLRDSFHGRAMLDVARHRQLFAVSALLLSQSPGGDVDNDGAVAAEEKRFSRPGAEICASAARRGVMNGVHGRHRDKFLGRYTFLAGTAAAVAEIEQFRTSLDAPDVEFDVLDALQKELGAVTLVLTHTSTTHGDGETVIRRSCIGSHEWLVVLQ